jgi:hypothetical protein
MGLYTPYCLFMRYTPFCILRRSEYYSLNSTLVFDYQRTYAVAICYIRKTVS